jgi:peptidyl-prolyl cis-trans isomerase C
MIEERSEVKSIINPLRYPLFWFLLIGGMLFVADSWLPDKHKTIVVDEGVRIRLADLWQAQSGKRPAPAELDSLVDNWVRQEVFYREALRLRLDRDDTIVRRRLIQKLNFIAEDVHEPDEVQLRRFYKVHIADYALPPCYTFSQVFFSPGHGDLLKVARRTITRDESTWRRFGDPSMLSDSYVCRSVAEISSTFGASFAEQMKHVEPGHWQGPISSTFGLHLVKVTTRQAGRTRSFTDVKRTVLADYLRERRDEARDTYYQRLLDRYEIVRE